MGPESNEGLKFDRFNFSDKSLVIVGEKRTDHCEPGVTVATDVHNGQLARRPERSGTIARRC